MNLQARILYNQDFTSAWRDRFEDQRFRLVDIHEISFDPTQRLEALEALFHQYNDGRRNREIGERSMSEGDIVILGEVALQAKSIGWESVDLRAEQIDAE